MFFWPIARAGGGSLLVAYTLAMAFTLVYTADHFVFDILLGWTYVIVVVARRSRWFSAASAKRRSRARFTDAERGRDAVSRR